MRGCLRRQLALAPDLPHLPASGGPSCSPQCCAPRCRSLQCRAWKPDCWAHLPAPGSWPAAGRRLQRWRPALRLSLACAPAARMAGKLPPPASRSAEVTLAARDCLETVSLWGGGVLMQAAGPGTAPRGPGRARGSAAAPASSCQCNQLQLQIACLCPHRHCLEQLPEQLQDARQPASGGACCI